MLIHIFQLKIIKRVCVRISGDLPLDLIIIVDYSPNNCHQVSALFLNEMSVSLKNKNYQKPILNADEIDVHVMECAMHKRFNCIRAHEPSPTSHKAGNHFTNWQSTTQRYSADDG